MPTDIPHQPDARPAVPQVESEDLVDLNLDESLEGDLQSVADEVASEYRTQMVPEMDLPDLPQPAADQDARVDLESALTEAEHQMEDMLRREAELMDQHRRLAADFNNFRNRAQRDISLAVEQAERKILLEMLPVLDNFERGLGASYQDVESFRAGVELIRKQFLESLRRLNVEQLPDHLQRSEPCGWRRGRHLRAGLQPQGPAPPGGPGGGEPPSGTWKILVRSMLLLDPLSRSRIR